MNDYDHALHCVLWGKWEDLFTLMLRSHDDLLKKRIEQFLHAYFYSLNRQEVIDMHDQLIAYLDYASEEMTLYSLE